MTVIMCEQCGIGNNCKLLRYRPILGKCNFCFEEKECHNTWHWDWPKVKNGS